MSADTLERFIELFQGNPTAIGTEQGGCHRLDPDYEYVADHIEKHLTGAGPPIGIYPMYVSYKGWNGNGPAGYGTKSVLEWYVHWGCIDFDEGEQESLVHATNVERALSHFDIAGWIERSRSKGYHVWVFLQEWLPAKLVREALLAACQLVDAPTREINPKQTELQGLQIGNYVRLPYPRSLQPPDWARTDLGRRVMIDPELGPIPFATFVDFAYAERTSEEQLQQLQHYYMPPKRAAQRQWDQVLTGEATERLFGKTRIIWEQGPLDGSDRSDTLWKLARYIYEDGKHTPQEAFDLLVDADARWGKFANRPDRDQRLQQLVDKAWG